jgi:hypothetical protein
VREDLEAFEQRQILELKNQTEMLKNQTAILKHLEDFMKQRPAQKGVE